MDPNANLAEQLRLAEQLTADDGSMDEDDVRQAADRLAELVIALNDWQRSGGFAPTPI